MWKLAIIAKMRAPMRAKRNILKELSLRNWILRRFLMVSFIKLIIEAMIAMARNIQRVWMVKIGDWKRIGCTVWKLKVKS